MSNSNFYKLFKSYKIFLKKNEQNNLKLFKKKNASNNKKKKNLGHYILDQKSALAINNDLDCKMSLSITH